MYPLKILNVRFANLVFRLEYVSLLHQVLYSLDPTMSISKAVVRHASVEVAAHACDHCNVVGTWN